MEPGRLFYWGTVRGIDDRLFEWNSGVASPELVITIDTVTDVAGRLRIGKDACSNLQPGPKPLKEVQRERNSAFCCLQLLATWQLQVTYIVMTIVNASDCCTMPEPSFEDAVSCFELYGCVQAAVVHANSMLC